MREDNLFNYINNYINYINKQRDTLTFLYRRWINELSLYLTFYISFVINMFSFETCKN